MADKLGDILKRRGSKPPTEIAVIKDFVKDKFKSDVAVAVKPGQITIIADNAALAGTLRLHLPQLEKILKTDQKLVIRIG